MQAEIKNELDDIFWRLDAIVRTAPECGKEIQSKTKKLLAVAENCKRVIQLQKAWPDMPQSVLLELSTEQSKPFVTVMLGLHKRRYVVSQMSMVNWWRRMCATGQEYLLTYFSWNKLEETFTGRTVLAQDLMRVCTDNQQLLNNITAAMSNDKCVDFKIRELLGGLSANSDVRKAWKDWAMHNHPDKGGDAETFLAVKLVYDEWCEIQNKLNNQSNKE